MQHGQIIEVVPIGGHCWFYICSSYLGLVCTNEHPHLVHQPIWARYWFNELACHGPHWGSDDNLVPFLIANSPLQAYPLVFHLFIMVGLPCHLSCCHHHCCCILLCYDKCHVNMAKFLGVL